ncbi:MAG: phosphatase PAP2 family protein [Candidatus Hydrothermia bacterium]|jgi:membrane-associated phospholipid phosphatase|nr:phosphatase PAP2 family protein [Candidatus Hydrothermia bacterium]
MIFILSFSDYQMSLMSISYFLIPYSIYNLDENIRKISLRNQNEFSNKTFNFLNEFGAGEYHISTFFILYLTSKALNNEKLEEFSKNAIKSFLISGATVLFLKTFFGRARPYMEKGPTSFEMFSINNNYNSLPSGHTIVAFTTASYISNYFKNRAISFLAYSVASGVGLARIYKDQHWFSDVLAGAVLGIIIGGNVK